MASGNEPSAFGLIILTGMTIAAVVGLYAYDVIPRRHGIAPASDIAWPRWQWNEGAPSGPTQQQTSAPPPAYARQPAYAPQGDDGYAPQDQSNGSTQPGYGPNQPAAQYPQQQQPQQEQYPPQDPRGQVPYDQQGSNGGAGQPPPPDYRQQN